jgi:hypothetical protein
LEGDEAGSTEVGEYCPRGWLHSPLHSGHGEEQRYDSLLSPSQKKIQEGHLGDYCAANTLETRAMIAEKMIDEQKRQERLRTARETCMPCTGTWPDCHCGQDQVLNKPKPIEKLQVTRSKVQADGVDQTLPRNDTVETEFDHGKPSLGPGAVCSKSTECGSGICGGGRCCTKESNGCSAHGVCNEIGNCLCEKGWFGPTCDRDSNVTKDFSMNDTSTLEKEGISKNMLAEMKNAFENGNASALGNALKNLTDVDRQNHEASKEYVGAVQTFSKS